MTRFKARMLRVAAVLGASLCAAALLSSCDVIKSWFVDEFADYRDSGQNFIAAEGFDKQDLTTAGYLSNASWTWAWRGATDADDAATPHYDYMTLAQNGTVGASAVSGLSSSANVYRLELVNLITEGDFEGASTTGWSANGSTLGIVVSPSAMHAGTGHALNIDNLAGATVYYSFSSLLDRAAGVTADHSYMLAMNTANATSFAYQVATSGSFLISDARGLDLSGEFTLPVAKASMGNQRLYIGSSQHSAVVLDDVRAARTDITNCLRLRLRPTDTIPTLTRGYYEFTVWARKPPSGYTFATENAAADPYATSAVTLWMGSPSGSDGSCSAVSSIASSSWTQLRLRQAAGGNFQALDPTSADAQMELQIYPFDINRFPEPGAVELAQPELHFYLNGY